MKNRTLIALLMALTMTIAPLTAAAYTSDMPPQMLQGLKEFIAENYVDEITVEELTGDTPEAVFEHLDQHSRYYDPQSFDQLLERLTGEFVGIGVYVEEKDGRIFITEPMEGSPSLKAGIQAGDEIITVDGKHIHGMTLEEVGGMIRGKVGTKVTLGIMREGHEEVLKITIKRGYITYQTVHHEIIDDVGYLAILEFNQNSYRDTVKALAEFQKNDLDKIIIDLRNNPGGLLNEVVNIARVLVNKGPILHINYRNTTISYMSYLSKPFFNNVVVLVNENSASASEVLAAAIQDSGAGVVVGTTTYGKGSVQNIYYSMDGGGFKLTEARYLSPNKRVIDEVGVKPNFVVEQVAGVEGDEQLDFALDYLSKIETKVVAQ